MKTLDRIAHLNIDEELFKVIEVRNKYHAFIELTDDIDSINNALMSDNTNYKKLFFMDNQDRVKNVINFLHSFLTDIENALSLSDDENYSEEEEEYNKLFSVISSVFNEIEKGIEKFNYELTISKDSKKEDIIINKDTIKDAINNNESTKQLVNDIQNPSAVKPDDKSEEIQNSFKDLSQNGYTRNDGHKGNFTRKFIESKAKMFLITDQSLSEKILVAVPVPTKEEINKRIAGSGIDNARIFELKEIPTKQKVVKRTVSFID